MITTLLPSSSERTRAISRITVVLPTPGLQEQDGLVARQHVLNHLHVASHRPADPAGEPHDLSTPVPDGRYAVQGTLDPRPVIPAEITDGRLRRVQVRLRDHLVAEKLVGDVAGEPRLGPAAEVEDDLEEL